MDPQTVNPATSDDAVEVDTLVEEVSIDGMCGVY
jgi:mycofactocin precursor